MILILVRIDRITGDVEIPGYEKWFVAKSIDFGVSQKAETAEGGDRDIEIGKVEVTELEIEKSIDAATVYLMQLAMKSRSQSAGRQPLNIDIHLAQNRNDLDGQSDSKKPVRAFMKIRIENAIVQEWGLTASEDGRPDESLKIWFNKAAIKYYATKDGKTYKTYGPVGWDQYGNVDFKSDELSKADN